MTELKKAQFFNGEIRAETCGKIPPKAIINAEQLSDILHKDSDPEADPLNV